jgi:uroporphyrinogen-III synthase
MRTVSTALRALVTRPRKEAEPLAAALATRGIEAILEPMMQVHFLAPPAFDLARVQAVLCTSANGVRGLARASGERRVPVFAVGDATAARAHAEGFTAVENAGGDVHDLARLITARLRPQGGRLLHVAGNVVAGDLAATLSARGFTVERSILYEAHPIAALSSMAVDAFRSRTIGFALFFSPRTAAVFTTLVARACVAECCGTITVLSISRAADTALAGLPWFDRRIAERPNQAALLAMLDRVLAERLRGRIGT